MWYPVHKPRDQVHTTGKQEGTTPKKLRGKRPKLPKEEGAPCALNERETCGDPAHWPGSPCLIEEGLCLTCGQRERKEVMNINDQMRAWQDTLDGGSIVEVRRAAVEILAQLRHTLENPTPPEGTGWVEDFTGKHYQEVSAMVDNVRGTLAEWEKNKKKTILVSIVREIVGTAE